MLPVTEQLLVLYLFIFSGFLIGKLKKKQSAHSDILSVLLVHLLLPSKVFHTFTQNFTTVFLREKYLFLLASAVLLSLLLVAAYFVSRLLSKNAYEQKVYRYSLTITNYSYLGYSLIEAVFGESALAEFIFFGIPFIVYTYTFGYALLTGGQKPWKKLLNPITVSILLGMFCGLADISLPPVLAHAVSMASACVGPLSMLLTGITLSTFSVKELLGSKTAYLFAALRLAVIPGVVYLACTLLPLQRILPMALIITSMPCGLNTIVFAKNAGEDCKPGARLALISHVAALVTIPLWLSFLM